MVSANHFQSKSNSMQLANSVRVSTLECTPGPPQLSLSHNTESDPRWGWQGLGTRLRHGYEHMCRATCNIKCRQWGVIVPRHCRGSFPLTGSLHTYVCNLGMGVRLSCTLYVATSGQGQNHVVRVNCSLGIFSLHVRGTVFTERGHYSLVSNFRGDILWGSMAPVLYN